MIGLSQEIAPYSGPGAVDDTMQSCLSLMPQPPKKDVVKMLGNEGRILRYEAVLVSKLLIKTLLG